MSYAVQVLKGTTRKLLLVQSVLILVVATVYLATKGGLPSLAALFGGAIALFNTVISAWHLGRASAAAGTDARRGMFELYIGAVIRFVATPLLVAVGILFLKLDPVAIIAGFAVAQLGYFFNSVRTKPDTPN